MSFEPESTSDLAIPRSAVGPSVRLGAITLFFLSGVAGLISQVIWVRRFGAIFGNTLHSAALATGVNTAGAALGALLTDFYPGANLVLCKRAVTGGRFGDALRCCDIAAAGGLPIPPDLAARLAPHRAER